MKAYSQPQVARLEDEVDNSTLFDVLESLQTICSDKAEHLRSNWQDERTAAAWDRAAKRIGYVLRNSAIRSL